MPIQPGQSSSRDAQPTDLSGGRAQSPVQLRSVVAPDGPEMDALLAIYEAAIPSRERKNSSDVRRLARSASHHVRIAAVAEEVLGFTITYGGQAFAALEYMAVRADARGRGLGEILFRDVEGLAPHGIVVLEVESDREESADRELRRRRIRFYGRLGCRRLQPLEYLLPLPGEGPPPMMDLLVAGVRERELSCAVVAEWLRETYAEVYGIPPADPRLTRTIAGMPPVLQLV